MEVGRGSLGKVQIRLGASELRARSLTFHLSRLGASRPSREKQRQTECGHDSASTDPSAPSGPNFRMAEPRARARVDMDRCLFAVNFVRHVTFFTFAPLSLSLSLSFGRGCGKIAIGLGCRSRLRHDTIKMHACCTGGSCSGCTAGCVRLGSESVALSPHSF